MIITRKEILNLFKGKEIKLLAASKKQSLEKILSLYEEGQRAFGENFVQELLEKKNELRENAIEWHLIGPLQTNKVGKVIGEVELIHSVDSLKLARAISDRCLEKGIQQKILIQINTSGELTKTGFSFENVESDLEQIFALPGISVHGFMTMPPLSDDPESSRPYFKALRELRDKYASRGATDLSMGTTQDFEVAISEGATIIRVGEALFGARNT